MNSSIANLAAQKRRAITLFQRGDLSSARALCSDICAIDASDPSIWCLLACIHGRTGKYEDAVSCARNSVRIRPAYDAAWVVLGDALLALKNPDEATVAYRHALESNSGNVDALCGQCKVSEMRHDLGSAREFLDAALNKHPTHAEANLYAAILDHRNGELESARTRLASLLANRPPDPIRLRACSELGKILERTRQYDDAFEAFEAGNRLQAREYKHTSADKGRIYEWIARHRDALQLESTSTWKTFVNDDELPDPVFLIGFPRSGTTLAEQLMASHSNIKVSNETPLLRRVINSMSQPIGMMKGYPYNLGQMSQSEIRRLRTRYWELVDQITGVERATTLFVDKLPMNTLFVPAIHRLFPDARIVFALRDPRDVCFSCYTNLFSANDAMVNFTDILDTAELYAATMDIWRTYQHEMALNIHELRYEKLVVQFEETARKLIAFLGLEWDDSVSEYYAEKNRRNVTTPSYRGIAGPLYSNAIGRWRHYARQFSPALSVLKPYVREFGYEATVNS